MIYNNFRNSVLHMYFDILYGMNQHKIYNILRNKSSGIRRYKSHYNLYLMYFPLYLMVYLSTQ